MVIECIILKLFANTLNQILTQRLTKSQSTNKYNINPTFYKSLFTVFVANFCQLKKGKKFPESADVFPSKNNFHTHKCPINHFCAV